MADIFLSYAKSDRKRIEALVRRLEGEGWSIFWDTQILLGDSWSAEIEEEMAKARCVVVAWSRAAGASPWVVREARSAINSGKPYIQLSIDGTPPPAGFGDLQYESLRWWRRWWAGRGDNAAVRRAVISLWRKIDPEKPGAQLPPPADEPWLNPRTISATLSLALLAFGAYHFGREPLQGFMRRQTLAAVKDWWFQLNAFKPLETGLLDPNDMLVLYYSRSALADAFKREEIERLRVRPDGRRRLVIAYLSIGGADEAAPFWNKDWVAQGRLTSSAPSWLIAPTGEPDGNYRVRYWEPSWLGILATNPGSYLEFVIAQGFDGVLLDDIDAYRGHEERASARGEMINLVRQVAENARTRNPSLLVLSSNAEELLAERSFLAAIDGVVKPSLLFKSEGPSSPLRRRSEQEISQSIAHIRLALAEGRPVFTVEFIRQSTHVDQIRRAMIANGFRPLVTDRDFASPSTEGYSLLEAVEREMNVTEPAGKGEADGADKPASPDLR